MGIWRPWHAGGVSLQSRWRNAEAVVQWFGRSSSFHRDRLSEKPPRLQYNRHSLPGGLLMAARGWAGTWRLAWHKNSLDAEKQTVMMKEEGAHTSEPNILSILRLKHSGCWLSPVLWGRLALNEEHPCTLRWMTGFFLMIIIFFLGVKSQWYGCLPCESELLQIRS